MTARTDTAGSTPGGPAPEGSAPGGTAQALAWIAVDWGTSRLRVWALGSDGAVLETRMSDRGMGSLSPSEFEPELLSLTAGLLPASGRLPVVVCGMAGSRQGWSEAPYLTVPCAPPQLDDATRVETSDARLDVRILPGLKQTGPADVMRGEETQIAGILAGNPSFDGVVCMPGTHTKWVRAAAGQVTAFRTFMTGEMFALLSERSVLRHTVALGGWDAEAFTQAAAEAAARPECVGAELFSLRAAALLADLAPERARARLSGLLIGMELAAARSWWQDNTVTIVGASGLAQAYEAALAAQGALPPRRLDAAHITLAGLTAARTTETEGAS